ncbi:MAG TPA: FAD-dependent oxidoreductase [Actinomycetota bacterium]|nr:FAD-dependent oxidoreductase [Actinomycetota bacterium]
MHDLVVLGAGPAGVGAAYRAAQKGLDVVLLERAPAPGGAAGSIEVGGMRVDFGSHRLHPSIDPRILTELQGLLADDLQVRPRHGRIRLAGRWIAFPLRGGDLIRRLPPSLALAAARDAALSWARRPRDDSFAEVLRAGIGPTMCERFYFPYARKLWGLDPADLSGEQARRRVAASSPAKLIGRVFGRQSAAKRTFLYPRRGFGQTWEALSAAAQRMGADVRFGVAAERVTVGADRVEVETSDGRVVARRCWSTLPLPVLARMSAPQPPEEVFAAAASLAFRAMILVYLILDAERYTPFDAHYLPEEGTPVTRVSEPKNYRDGDDPPGRTVLCAEVPCDPGDPVWSRDDRDLADLVVDGLIRSGLPDPRPVGVEVRRLSHAYPIYRRGFEHAFEVLDAWASDLPRVLTFGRQGLFAHDNSHHALAMAWAAADALEPGGGFDRSAWHEARAVFRTHVVED